MKENCFSNAIKDNEYLRSMHDNDVIQCSYFDSQEFISLNVNQPNNLNIFLLNISSLPKHGGELVCFLNSMQTTFHIIVLNEIGKNNLSMMENLIEGYTFFYEPPISNLRGGVGIYINDELSNVVRKSDIEFERSCGCALCEVECLCIYFDICCEPFA